MKKFIYIIVILFLLSLIVPVLSKNSDFISIMNSIWGYAKDFSAWAINEIDKLIKLIPHK